MRRSLCHGGPFPSVDGSNSLRAHALRS
jgi:hypothetical protein